MAYLRMTDHFKGPFPVDIGGVSLSGYGQKEVSPDEFAERLVKGNYPYVALCDRAGKYLSEIPTLTVVPKAEVPEPVVEQEPSKSETPEETGPTPADGDALSASIEIELPKKPVTKRK